MYDDNRVTLARRTFALNNLHGKVAAVIYFITAVVKFNCKFARILCRKGSGARGGEKFLILQPEFNGDIYARCTPRKVTPA